MYTDLSGADTARCGSDAYDAKGDDSLFVFGESRYGVGFYIVGGLGYDRDGYVVQCVIYRR